MQKVDMGKQAWDENQVDGPIAQYLIGDAEVAAGRVTCLGQFEIGHPNRPNSRNRLSTGCPLINGDAERPEHASHPFPKIDPNKLWMIIWVDAIDRWLLFRAFERGQIINNCADILGSYRGLVVVDHLVDFRCPSLLRQRWLVQHHAC